MEKPLILTGNLKKGILTGEVVIVTGAGQGIGFETARSLAWLGANVIIAEIDKKKGKIAAKKINNELKEELALFINTDVRKSRSINKLAKEVIKKYKKVDVIINNATVTPLSSVKNSKIINWDYSYEVNLRGPVLLAQKFLPFMLEQNHGTFLCVFSEGLAYMGQYETMKSAQNHLASTLDAELEDTNVISFSIGPGFVPTETATKAISELAKLYGKTEEELYSMFEEHIISVEAAGASFAAATALASNFSGQEIGAKQALLLAGIDIDNKTKEAVYLSDEDIDLALTLCMKVRNTLFEQSKGWEDRSIFERQWLLRDFKKNAGMTVQQWLDTLTKVHNFLQIKDLTLLNKLHFPIEKLSYFYSHLQDLTKSYIKDKDELKKNLDIIKEWEETTDKLHLILTEMDPMSRT